MDIALVTEQYILETAFRRWGLSPKRSGKAWNMPCPKCGGFDRAIIFKNGYCWCRKQCGFADWLDSDSKQFVPDPLFAQRRKEELEAHKKEQENLDKAWREGYKVGYIRGWHDAMSQENREWWYSRGVTDDDIDFYELGFLPSKKVFVENKEFEYPAYTIPKRDPNDWEIHQVDYRLVGAPKSAGKYRQEGSISPYPFFANINTNGAAIVLEGSVKAIVTNRFMEHEYQVIGLPSCTPGEDLIEMVLKYDPVWIVLDPGCHKEARRIREIVKHAKIVPMSEKPDDAFLNGMTARQFKSFMRQAR